MVLTRLDRSAPSVQIFFVLLSVSFDLTCDGPRLVLVLEDEEYDWLQTLLRTDHLKAIARAAVPMRTRHSTDDVKMLAANSQRLPID
jgi:hypothetical protein